MGRRTSKKRAANAKTNAGVGTGLPLHGSRNRPCFCYECRRSVFSIRFQPPVSPLEDIRYVDFFDPNYKKKEFISVDLNGFQRSFYINPGVLADESPFLLKSYSEMPYNHMCQLAFHCNLSTLLKIHGPKPGKENFYENLCTYFDIVALSIALKYHRIIESFDKLTKEKLLKMRDPILSKTDEKGNKRIMNKGLIFYEWLMSLMRKYRDHNETVEHDQPPPTSEFDDISPFDPARSLSPRTYPLFFQDFPPANAEDIENCYSSSASSRPKSKAKTMPKSLERKIEKSRKEVEKQKLLFELKLAEYKEQADMLRKLNEESVERIMAKVDDDDDDDFDAVLEGLTDQEIDEEIERLASQLMNTQL